MRAPRIVVTALMAALAPAAPPVAQQWLTGWTPPISAERLERRGAGGRLGDEIAALVTRDAPVWAGYAVPMAAMPGRAYNICCVDGDACCGPCRLDEDHHGMRWSRDGDEPDPESPDRLMIFFRAGSGRIDRLRTFSGGCGVDAGKSLVWLTGVGEEESLGWLSGLLDDREGRRSGLFDEALGAIALHRGDGADRILERMLSREEPGERREKAAFWMGTARGERGYRALEEVALRDPSAAMREKVAFPLSQSPVPEAVDTLIRMARSDRSGGVRGQALFWLAQKASEKAVAAISGAIEDDPDTEVKKSAVFALSQLPRDRAVPLLIRLAKENPNAEVRKQAIFWLGQTNDPRALDFIEEILNG